MRQVVLDTETTGLEVEQGHRILEIGCVEILDRKITRRHFHQYINPERDIDEGALEVHGITLDFLADKPRFHEIWQPFLDFVEGSELIIHNAAFDVTFIDAELQRLPSRVGSIKDYCSVIDTLEMARLKHPGQKNSLDALCKRYHVDNSQRDLHGALLDAEILADVYLLLTGGQVTLHLGADEDNGSSGGSRTISLPADRPKLRVIAASAEEMLAHEAKLEQLDSKAEDGCVWKQLEQGSGESA